MKFRPQDSRLRLLIHDEQAMRRRVINWLRTASNNVWFAAVVSALALTVALIATVEARADPALLLCSGTMRHANGSNPNDDEVIRQFQHEVKEAISMNLDVSNNTLTIDGFGAWQGGLVVSSSGDEIWRFSGSQPGSADLHHNRVTGDVKFSIIAPIGKQYWLYVFDGNCRPGKKLF